MGLTGFGNRMTRHVRHYDVVQLVDSRAMIIDGNFEKRSRPREMTEINETN